MNPKINVSIPELDALQEELQKLENEIAALDARLARINRLRFDIEVKINQPSAESNG